MRLIDADTLAKRLAIKNPYNVRMQVMLAKCIAEVNAMPTIEPERKKGKWIQKPHPIWSMWGMKVLCCSECGITVGDYKTNFCSNCGADMREEDKNDSN